MTDTKPCNLSTGNQLRRTCWLAKENHCNQKVRGRGDLHNSYWKIASLSENSLWASSDSFGNRSCWSIWKLSFSTLTLAFAAIVTAWFSFWSTVVVTGFPCTFLRIFSPIFFVSATQWAIRRMWFPQHTQALRSSLWGREKKSELWRLAFHTFYMYSAARVPRTRRSRILGSLEQTALSRIVSSLFLTFFSRQGRTCKRIRRTIFLSSVRNFYLIFSLKALQPAT